MEKILFRRSLVCGIVLLLLGLGVTSSLGSYSQKYPLSAAQLAYWPFDEGTGTTAQDQWNDYDGDIVGATWTTGHDGFALNFNGEDAYVDLDDHSVDLGFNKADEYEIDVYIKSEATTSGIVYSMSHSESNNLFCDLEMGSDGTFIFRVGTIECVLNATSDAGYNDGDWHRVQGKYFGATTNPTMEIWVDGSMEDTITEWQCPFNKDDFATAKIGRKGNAATMFFDGAIDELKLYYSGDNDPPSTPALTGASEVKKGSTYTLTFQSSDPNGDDVKYHIDWGDEEQEWTSFYTEGTSQTATHTYDNTGDVIIKVYAQDEPGDDSGVAEKSLTVPKNKASSFNILNWLFELFPILKYLI